MPPPEYIDCFLKVSAHNQATFEFQGESYSGKPKLDPAALQPLLLKAEADAKEYGARLFGSLFIPDDNLISGYRSAISMSRRMNSRLRFHVQIDVNAPPDLFALNWERLYDEKERQALSRWTQTAFSRFAGLGQQIPDVITGQPRLLVVISSPVNFAAGALDKIDRAQVKAEMLEALQPLSSLVQYEFLELPATRANIRERLKDGFHAVHIQAHSVVDIDRTIAWMMLEHENGEADPIDEDAFREIFNGLPDLRLVTLIACQSGAPTRDDPFGGLALTLVQQNLPAVIAMQQPIEFDAAKIFNKYFYKELARHGQVDVAVNEARLHLRLALPKENQDWNAPVLFLRSMDGRVWNRLASIELHEPEVPVATMEDTFWEPILQALRQGELIPITGPGINYGLLPSNEDVTRLWMKRYEYRRYNYPIDNRNDLARVARFVEARNSPKFPHRALQILYTDDLLERETTDIRAIYKKNSLDEVITATARRYLDQDADAPHRILADLPISTYLTTTPDNFMAEALKHRGRQPQRALFQWWEGAKEPADYQLLEGHSESPLVWHLYGAAPKTNSLVLTEDDHLDFLRNVSKDDWRLPATLMQKLTESLLLFIGFNVRDLDFRVMFKSVISQLKVGSARIAILQIEPEESYKERELDLKLVRNFLEQDSTELKIKIGWLSVREFLLSLRSRV